MSEAKVSPEVMRKIARLARLRLTPEEEVLFAGELEKVLGYVEQLGQVDTAGIDPIVHGFPLDEHFREDEARQLSEAETQEILACSESPLYEQYRVPQVIGGES